MARMDRTAVIDALYAVDLDEDALREDYSGRFMYGDTCVGFVGDSGQLTELVAELTDRSDGAFTRIAGQARYDSMGRQSIMYFERLTLDDDLGYGEVD